MKFSNIDWPRHQCRKQLKLISSVLGFFSFASVAAVAVEFVVSGQASPDLVLFLLFSSLLALVSLA
jgi:hypothetical protein